jgi:hypothetical protein
MKLTTKTVHGKKRTGYVRRWRTLPVSHGVASAVLPAGSINIGIRALAAKGLRASYWTSVPLEDFGETAPLGLDQVDWPDTLEGNRALLQALGNEVDGRKLVESDLSGDPNFSLEFSSADWEYRGLVISAMVATEEDPSLQTLAALIVWGGCGQASARSPEVANWFEASGDQDFMARFEESMANRKPGQLDWFICPSTYHIEEGRMKPPQEWHYLAAWTDGDWSFAIESDNEQTPTTAIKALVAAAKSIQAAGIR